MSPILTSIIIFVAIVALMVVQTIITKLHSPIWGAIIPIFIVVTAVFAFFVFKIAVTLGSVLVFVIPFIWSLEEIDRGRKCKAAKVEKEIAKMKAKDIS